MKTTLFVSMLMMTSVFSIPVQNSLAADPDTSSVVRIEFTTMPDGWVVQGKPFTKDAVFAIGQDPNDPTNQWLEMTADNASASLKTAKALAGVDLTKLPIMRWSWRVTEFPTGGDGRDSSKDDQAIGLYISSGGMFSQKSVAYRWETETPAGTNGSATYAKIVSVRWFCLRNKDDAKGGAFLVEERNVAEDYKAAFGTVPSSIGLGISCNSQYTKSKAAAQLQWIEFAPSP